VKTKTPLCFLFFNKKDQSLLQAIILLHFEVVSQFLVREKVEAILPAGAVLRHLQLAAFLWHLQLAQFLLYLQLAPVL
jgi:hypothetical protein